MDLTKILLENGTTGIVVASGEEGKEALAKFMDILDKEEIPYQFVGSSVKERGIAITGAGEPPTIFGAGMTGKVAYAEPAPIPTEHIEYAEQLARLENENIPYLIVGAGSQKSHKVVGSVEHRLGLINETFPKIVAQMSERIDEFSKLDYSEILSQGPTHNKFNERQQNHYKSPQITKKGHNCGYNPKVIRK